MILYFSLSVCYIWLYALTFPQTIINLKYEICTNLDNKSLIHDKKIGFRKLGKLQRNSSKVIAIQGVPISWGQSRAGTEHAPIDIRNEGLVAHIKDRGFIVKDYGDLSLKTNNKDKEIQTSNEFTKIKMQYSIGDAIKLIEQKVKQILSRKEKLVIIGGDHSLTAGSISGHSDMSGELCVIYIDAHADINTCDTTRSGNIHGMPLSLVVKEISSSQRKYCPGLTRIRPVLSAKNLGYIGLRDVDDAELKIINDLNIMHFTMEDVDRLGVRRVVRHLIDSICAPLRSIHVSFDIDSVDAMIVPNTGTPVPGGLTLREVFQIGEIIAKTNRLKVFEMYEINTKVGPTDHSLNTLNLAINIISFLGKTRESFYAQPIGSEHYNISINKNT